MEWLGSKNEMNSEFLSRHLKLEFEAPLDEYISRKRKNFRGQLVEVGLNFGLRSPDLISAVDKQAVIRAIECLHAGTLILDDIQDGSVSRRGMPTLHLQMGIPRAINLGSWMFFAAQKIIAESGLKTNQKQELLDHYRKTLYWGHIGQSIDLSSNMLKVSRAAAQEVVEQSHRYKTGVMTSLALLSGCILNSATRAQREKAESLGEALGLLLQKIDDLKNLKFDEENPAKQFEDLRNFRPTFVWCWASRQQEPCWQELKVAVYQLPETQAVVQWIKRWEVLERGLLAIQQEANFVIEAHANCSEHLKRLLDQLVTSYRALKF